MKSTLKLIRRFVLILLLSVTVLLALNVILAITVTYQEAGNGSGWEDARNVSASLTETAEGGFVLSEAGAEILSRRGAWAILISDSSGDVIWHSADLPPEIPLHYSAAEIAASSRGYIEDFPTITAPKGDDLLVLGFPKDTYWKLMWNTFDYSMIVNLPKTLLLVLSVNLAAVVLIYFLATSGFLRSVRPIIRGIESLPEESGTYVKSRGLLSELAESINRASEKLRMQERELRRRENARADWISGVSHDIRTPLSMVMGYAVSLSENPSLPEQERKKAEIICSQSVRIRNLINDLNLASRLEYRMQPLNAGPVSLVTLLRQAVVDFINSDPEGRYPVSWETPGELERCLTEGDSGLIRRAVQNILNNAREHNPQGCRITAAVTEKEDSFCILIGDDGIGITEEKLQELIHTPHYMMSDSKAAEPRHGLGLLIVRQIAEAHGGSVSFGHGRDGGFAVRMFFPRDGARKKAGTEADSDRDADAGSGRRQE